MQPQGLLLRTNAVASAVHEAGLTLSNARDVLQGRSLWLWAAFVQACVLMAACLASASLYGIWILAVLQMDEASFPTGKVLTCCGGRRRGRGKGEVEEREPVTMVELELA